MFLLLLTSKVPDISVVVVVIHGSWCLCYCCCHPRFLVFVLLLFSTVLGVSVIVVVLKGSSGFCCGCCHPEFRIFLLLFLFSRVPDVFVVVCVLQGS